jgi:hypothetical protein
MGLCWNYFYEIAFIRKPHTIYRLLANLNLSVIDLKDVRLAA